MTGPASLRGGLLDVLRRQKHRLSGAATRPRLWFGRRLVAGLCREEFERQQVSRNERSIEYRFVFEQLTRVGPETVLDVGPGTTALPSLMRVAGHVVTAIDNVRDYWPAGMVNRHFHVLDDDITAPKLRGPFDFVTCVSVLEHIVDSDAAIDNMFALLRPGGHLVVTCPYTEDGYCANVYGLRDSDAYGAAPPYVCQSYSRAQLAGWLGRNNAVVVRQEYWRLYSGEFWSCGDLTWPPVEVAATDRHQITCLLLQKAS